MSEEEITYYWNYYRVLCKKFGTTVQYVDHSVYGSSLKNAAVNSWEYQQCLILAASEFENICKLLCHEINPKFDSKSNIVDISKCILSEFKLLPQTKVCTDYQELEPLKNWQVCVKKNQNPKGKNVSGLDWWDAYTDIKHNSYINFAKATLENTLNALASLMVVELYLMKKVTGSLRIASSKPCCYFYCYYASEAYVTDEQDLPDFADANTNPNKYYKNECMGLNSIKRKESEL